MAGTPLQIVWGNNAGGPTTTVSASFPVNMQGATAIVVVGMTRHASGDTLNISDTAGSTYNTIANLTLNDATSPATMKGWVAANSKSSANTITVTDATGSGAMGIVIMEISGIVLSSPLDGGKSTSAVNPGTGAGLITSGPATPGGATNSNSVFCVGVSWLASVIAANTFAAANFGTVSIPAISAASTNIAPTGNGTGTGIGAGIVQWLPTMPANKAENAKFTDATNGAAGVFDSMLIMLDEANGNTLLGQACY